MLLLEVFLLDRVLTELCLCITAYLFQGKIFDIFKFVFNKDIVFVWSQLDGGKVKQLKRG